MSLRGVWAIRAASTHPQVETLVAENANCTMLNVSGHTPLDLACQSGHAQVYTCIYTHILYVHDDCIYMYMYKHCVHVYHYRGVKLCSV